MTWQDVYADYHEQDDIEAGCLTDRLLRLADFWDSEADAVAAKHFNNETGEWDSLTAEVEARILQSNAKILRNEVNNG